MPDVECKSGKQCFASAGAASRVARSMNEYKRKNNRKQSGHAPARVYECELCGQYHITGAKDMKRIKVKYVPTEERIEIRNLDNN